MRHSRKMKLKSFRPENGCVPKQTKCLRMEKVTWVPQSKKDLGELINGRYYVMKKSDEKDCWLSFDVSKKEDCLIRQSTAKCFDVYESDDEDEPIPCQYGDVLKDRYHVLKMLSKTSLSTVWLTYDARKQRDRVVKLSNSSSFGVAVNEIGVMEKIRKKDINKQFIILLCDRFDEILSSGMRHVCLVMEEMQQNLLMFQQTFDKNTIPLKIVKQIAQQILIGLDNLHKCGFIHADIKPENVLVTQCSLTNSERLCPDRQENCEMLHLKLADFGNSKRTNNFEIASAHTLTYSGPEAILGLILEPAADIWSTACVLFEMATGMFLISKGNGDNEEILECLYSITEYFGPMPQEVLQRATYRSDYYDPNGNLCGAEVLHPFSLEECLDDWMWPKSVAEPFIAFLLPMLKLDPMRRATAAEALQHPWLAKTNTNYRMT